MPKQILVTGGLGYIGSHTVIELVQSGYTVTIVDNLSNSRHGCLERIREIIGPDYRNRVRFANADICNTVSLAQIYGEWDACIHFAALKSVRESVRDPLGYYRNNVAGTLSLLCFLRSRGCHRVVFSSSATVYGSAEPPCAEDAPTGVGITNPYGWTKAVCEGLFRDLVVSDDAWRVSVLRYFNPIGAHSSGKIGEDPTNTPSNLMPYLTQVCAGSLDRLTVFGDDYETEDGTCERDYVHVVDLAKGHVAALRRLFSVASRGMEVYNLGTGRATSVLDLVRTMEKVYATAIPVTVSSRREGDVSRMWADVSKAEQVLGWKAELTVEDACRDALRTEH